MSGNRIETLADDLARGDLIRSADLEELRGALLRYVRTVTSRERADESVDEALARFVAAALQGRVKKGSAWPFLKTIAKNHAHDVDRRERVAVSHLGKLVEPDDDDVAALFEPAQNAQELEAALDILDAHGDRTAVRVCIAWLRLAVRTGGSPTLREVAQDVSLSPVGVMKALGRARVAVEHVRAV